MKALDHALAAVIPTALGLVGVEVGPHGVRQLRLPQPTERGAWDALGRPPLGSRVRPEALGDLAGRLRAYFRGEPAAFADVVDLDGVSAFQRAVYTAARAIPFGQVISYGELAVSSGHPMAARAVGQALAHNPVCLIIPCHRVVGAGGALVGFSGGLELKQRLLRLEATPSQAGAVVGRPAPRRSTCIIALGLSVPLRPQVQEIAQDGSGLDLVALAHQHADRRCPEAEVGASISRV